MVAQDLSFSHGPTVVLDGVTVTVASGHRIGVVGPNGVGKSTLLRLLVGELTPASGVVRRVPADTRVGFLTQELSVEHGEAVADVVARRSGVTEAQAEFDAATIALSDGVPGADERYDAAFERWTATGAADFQASLDVVLERVGLGADRAGQDASTLSGGERARVNLASVLLS